MADVDLTEDEGVLPPSYRLALQLEDAGRSEAEIAARLGVPEESIPLLLVLARRKAERVRNRNPDKRLI